MSQATSAVAMGLLREGIQAARANNKERARQFLREVTRLDTGNEHAWLWLAGVIETPQEALSCLQRVLEINPDNAAARKGLVSTRLQLGIAEAKAGRKRTARRLLMEVVKHHPENEHAWMWLAGVAETPQDGLVYLGMVREINPSNEHVGAGMRSLLVQAGIAEAQAGNKEAAQGHLRAALELEPRDEQAWHWLAGVVESPTEAIACLERVLEINPDNSRATETLQWFRSQLDASAQKWQCPLCQEAGGEAVDVCPTCHALLTLDDPDAFFTTVAIRTDKVEEAVARFEAALAAGPDFTSHFNLGLAYLNLQRPDAALECFQDALTLLPEHRALQTMTAELVRRKDEAEERARQERAQKPLVLVIDDSATVRKLVTMTLEKEGYRVTAAADGEEGLDRLDEEPPALVLLDISMPGKDGYQICKTIRANEATSQVPVVMLSGKDGFFDKLRGRLAGSSDYVTKPFKSEALVEVVRRRCRTN